MERWLRFWESSREDQLSAVVLLAAGTAFQHPMQPCLQRVARQKGVEFMCEFYDPAQANQRLANYRAPREETVPAIIPPRFT